MGDPRVLMLFQGQNFDFGTKLAKLKDNILNRN